MLIILLSRHSCRKLSKKILYNLIKIIFVNLLKKLFDNATSTIMVSSASGQYNLNQARSGFPLISRKNMLSYRYIPYNKSLLGTFIPGSLGTSFAVCKYGGPSWSVSFKKLFIRNSSLEGKSYVKAKKIHIPGFKLLTIKKLKKYGEKCRVKQGKLREVVGRYRSLYIWFKTKTNNEDKSIIKVSRTSPETQGKVRKSLRISL